jgi:hypothetical protein
LKRDIPVIPVLVRGARMPTAEQLPDDLKELAFRNCIELSHARWKSDIQLLIDALRRLPGISATKENAGTGQALKIPEKTASYKAESEGLAAIDPADIERVSRELAVCIGPIAFVVVKRAAASCASVEDLYLKVADEIDSREERERFLRHTSVSSTPLPQAAGAVTSISETRIGETRIEPPSPRAENSDVPSKTASAVARAGQPKGSKYTLVAGGAVISLVLLTWLLWPALHNKRSSQTAQTSRPEKDAARGSETKPHRRLLSRCLPQGATNPTKPKRPQAPKPMGLKPRTTSPRAKDLNFRNGSAFHRTCHRVF